MRTFHLAILASDHVVFDGECESLVVPTTIGQLGILAGHSNLVVAIDDGTMFYREPAKEKEWLAITRGLLRVENNDVLVIASAIERPEDIDIARSEAEAREAEEEMRKSHSVNEYVLTQGVINRNANRIRVKKNHYDPK